MRVIIDTREQLPLPFESLGCEIISKKLDEGDYSTVDLLEYEQATGEKTVRIERKRNTAELAGNLGKDFTRFEKELQRLLPYKRKILLCEFTYDDILKFPEGSGIPKNRWFRKGKNGRMVKNVRMTPQVIISKLEYIENIYDIEIIYCPNKFEAAKKVIEVFNVFEEEIKG